MSSVLTAGLRRGAALLSSALGAVLSSGGHLTPDQLAEPDSRFRAVDGVRVHYKLLEAGGARAGREAFVAVHGFGANLSTFADALPPLVRRRAPAAAVAFDSPGFGLTERPSLLRLERYRAGFLAKIVRGLRPAGGRPVVIGFSIGARAALSYAVGGAEVKGLVLIAPGVLPAAAVAELARRKGVLKRGVDFVRALVGQALTWVLVGVSVVLNPVLVLVLRLFVGNAKFWVRGLGMARGDPTMLSQRDVDAYRRPLAVRNWAGGILNFTRSMVLQPRSDVFCLVTQLGKMSPQVPVLIVHGSKDRVIPLSNSQVLVKQIPGARLVVMEGKGHVPHEEDGEGFAKVVDDWLESGAFRDRR